MDPILPPPKIADSTTEMICGIEHGAKIEQPNYFREKLFWWGWMGGTDILYQAAPTALPVESKKIIWCSFQKLQPNIFGAFLFSQELVRPPVCPRPTFFTGVVSGPALAILPLTMVRGGPALAFLPFFTRELCGGSLARSFENRNAHIFVLNHFLKLRGHS